MNHGKWFLHLAIWLSFILTSYHDLTALLSKITYLYILYDEHRTASRPWANYWNIKSNKCRWTYHDKSCQYTSLRCSYVFELYYSQQISETGVGITYWQTWWLYLKAGLITPISRSFTPAVGETHDAAHGNTDPEDIHQITQLSE